MTPEQVAEAWTVLDRGRLAELARRGPVPIFATISGAHLYGFASRDSDVDLRGAFLHPLRAMLSLHAPRETITVKEEGDIELDRVAHAAQVGPDVDREQRLRSGAAVLASGGAREPDVYRAARAGSRVHHAADCQSLSGLRTWPRWQNSVGRPDVQAFASLMIDYEVGVAVSRCRLSAFRGSTPTTLTSISAH